MEWYKSSYRRNLIDMHISDFDESFLSGFSADSYVQALKKAKVDTAIIYAGSCLGVNFYPTKIGYTHKNLRNRDILKETTDKCKEAGLKVVVYFNIWSRYAYDLHPEWRMTDVNGKGYQVDMGQRFGQCCPNTGYSEYVRNMITELVSSYGMDGLWIDMIGWFGAICYCPECKARFRNETGKEIPTVIDWTNKDFLTFTRKREEWFTEMAAMITSTAKKVKPGITVTQQCASWTLGWTGAATRGFFSQSDYLAGDFYEGSVEQSVICKYLTNMSNNKPIEFMVSRCTDLTEHTLSKSYETIFAQRCSALANNCAFVFIDAIDPAGTIDHRTYDQMGEIFDSCAGFEKFSDFDAEICADVGIILSQSSMINFDANGKQMTESASDMNTLKGIYRIAGSLLEAKITFDILDLNDYKKIENKKMLILSDIVFLSEQETDLLKRYISNGGILYASGRTSLYDPDGDTVGDFALSEVFGVSFEKEDEDRINYIAPLAKYSDLLNGFNAKYPLSVSGKLQRFSAHKDVEVLGTLTKCYYKPGDINEFASAISDPPGRATDIPVLTRNIYGKGTAIYSSGSFETSPHEASRDVLVSIIRHHITNPLIITDAPKPVEIIVFRKDTGYQVSILNFQNKLPPVPVYNINMQVYTGADTIEEIYDVEQGKYIEYSIIDGYVTFNVEKLNYLNMFLININDRPINKFN